MLARDAPDVKYYRDWKGRCRNYWPLLPGSTKSPNGDEAILEAQPVQHKVDRLMSRKTALRELAHGRRAGAHFAACN
jgi:hypothetical protein